MGVFLEGNGGYDFRLHTGRIEYEEVAGRVGPVPISGLTLDCVAGLFLDDRHAIDFGNGVAAGVMLKGPKTVPAGWFHWKQARQYRQEIEALGIARDDFVLCRSRLRGGEEVRYRKGPKRMCFHLWLDLDWPLRSNNDWFTPCGRYLLQIDTEGKS